MLLLALPSIGALAGCKEKAAGADGPKAASEVDVELSAKALEAAHVQIGAVARTPRRTTVTVAGAIDFVPSRVARIGPSVAGRVGQVLVAPGQQVTKGAAVVALESVDVGRARADFLEAQSKLERANAEVAREEKLLAAGATSERAVVQARTDQSIAQSELRAAQARLSTLGASGGGGPTTVPLVTPLAGRVLEVKARIGQPVGPTDTLVVVGEIDQIWLTVDVYERDFAKVHLGDGVRVTAVAYPKRTFNGKVDLIDTVVDPDRKVAQARIVLDNPDGALRPGMTATARIVGEPVGGAAQVLSVPRGAIQAIDGQPFVFVELEKGKFEMRPVERGDDLDDGVEIVRGLSGDEKIVTEGTFILKSEVLKEQLGTND
jgi:cobalt-zinc-cadmium efflux system membrane fusion protein